MGTSNRTSNNTSVNLSMMSGGSPAHYTTGLNNTEKNELDMFS